jgi:chitodextrinase
MMTLLELAQKLRPYIEKAAISLSDEDALEAIDLFGSWQSDKAYVVDDKVKYEGILYKCLQAHTSQDAWTPVAAPSLWAKVLIPDPNVVPDWEQPDNTNAYMIGDKVSHNEKHWVCNTNYNTWEPGVYGWDEA